MGRRKLNEKSTGFLIVKFYDENGDPVTPSTIDYTIHDIASGTEVKASTNIGSPAQQIIITLTVADNTLINNDNESEGRLVTVTAGFGGGEAQIQEFDYGIQPLEYVS